MRKKTLFTYVATLTAAGAITRIIGFFYRIFMARYLGDSGMGIYQLIMPVYILAWSISSAGLTTTMSKLASNARAKNESGDIRLILKICISLCLIISLILSLGLFFFSDVVALNILKDGRAIPSLKLLAICFPFMSAGSCIRGYFFGMQNSKIPAASQIIEQIIRTLTGVMLFSLVPLNNTAEFVAGAILGIVLGEAISFLFVFYEYKKQKPLFSKSPSISLPAALSLVALTALPLSGGRVVTSLLSAVENVFIPDNLSIFYGNKEIAMSEYGRLMGMAVPVIQLPSALLMAVSTALVPTVSEGIAVNNLSYVRRTVYKSVLFTSVIGMGMAGTFSIFYKELATALFNSNELSMLIFKLSPICPLLYMQITLSGILNGLGKHSFILKNSLLSSLITLSFIYFLMPKIGLDAFIYGWFLSLSFTVLLSLKNILKYCKLKADISTWFIKPVLCALASGLTVKYIFRISGSDVFTVILCFLLMAVMYLIFLMLSGVLKKDDFIPIKSIALKTGR